MLLLLKQLKSISIIGFISQMFISIAENEMDERDCHPIHAKERSCPMRKFIPNNPK